MNRSTKGNLAFFWSCTGLFSGLAAYLSIRSTSLYGAGLSPDSVSYVRLARGIADNGFGFLQSNQAVLQPPFYPVTLAVFARLTGADPLLVARFINPVLASLLVLLILLSVRRFSLSPLVILITGILGCFSIPIVAISSMVWTEMLFITMLYALLLAMATENLSTRTVLLGALLAGLICLTRYAGVVAIPVATSCLLIFSSENRSRRIRLALIFFFVASSILGIHLARNLAVTGTIAGSRLPSTTALSTNIGLTTWTSLSWFFPQSVLSQQHSVQEICVAILGLGLVLLWQRRYIAGSISAARREVVCYSAFLVAYVAFVVTTSSLVNYDPIDTRLLSPIYPSIVVLLAVLFNQGLRPPSAAPGAVASLSAVGLLLVFTPVHSALEMVQHKALHGAGEYSSRSWRESETLSFVVQARPIQDIPAFSNAPDALYILADLEANWSPTKHHPGFLGKTVIGSDDLFSAYPTLDGAILIWFHQKQRPYLFRPDQLARLSTLQTLARFRDGAIYRVARLTNN